MIKNRYTFAPKLWWYLCILILIKFPAVQSCKKSTPSCSHCNQNISTANHLPRFSKVQRNDLCPYTDMCLRIETGDICDHARLYYDTRSDASKVVLHGYLHCGGDGVSVTGTSPTFDKYYVTFVSSRLRQNRFFVNEMGNTIITSMKNIVSFDESDPYEEQAVTHYSNKNNLDLRENQIDFARKYPPLLRYGYDLNIVAFYDKAFKEKSHQLGSNSNDVIDQIFNLVSEFFKDNSLDTKFHLYLRKKIYKSGVNWSNAKSNATINSLKQVDFYSEEEADIYAYLGSMNVSADDTILGKVPKNGRCFLNNDTCCGVCSGKRYERTFVVECDIENLLKTAYIITHEIGHLLGLPHDFVDRNEYVHIRQPRQSMVNIRTPCTNVSGIMDYGNKDLNKLKWTECSNEWLRIYHQSVKDASTKNKFCLEPHSHTTTVEHFESLPLELICDIRKCGGDSVTYVTWYLEDGTILGSYSPMFKDTDIEPEYSNNTNMIYKEEKVILRISTYESSLQNAYCIINAETTKTFCESKQTFEIKPPEPTIPTDTISSSKPTIPDENDSIEPTLPPIPTN